MLIVNCCPSCWPVLLGPMDSQYQLIFFPLCIYKLNCVIHLFYTQRSDLVINKSITPGLDYEGEGVAEADPAVAAGEDRPVDKEDDGSSCFVKGSRKNKVFFLSDSSPRGGGDGKGLSTKKRIFFAVSLSCVQN